MKLKKFKEKNIKKKVILFSIGGIILLLAGIYLCKTFAIFEENREFNIIKGQVPNQRYDVMLSYNIINDDGTKIFFETIPEGKEWGVSIECDHGATGVWDYEEWAPLIKNLNDSRTKCSLNFKKPVGTLIDVIKSVPVVTNGDGLYEINHDDANITYTTDTTAINNLKQTELRYAGSNPDNYVKFNNELWRIIGLVNTSEGQRVKIIRNEAIGVYSWDSSESSINNGLGVNEWNGADLMVLLNNGAYYNRTSGTCYNGSNNQTTSCDFSKIGLTNYAKSMIDTVTWNLGANPIIDSKSLATNEFYSAERGNVTGKRCSSGEYCIDSVARALTWIGQVGLMYSSDYGYATSERTCLTKKMDSLDNWGISCRDNDWLYLYTTQWTLMPFGDSNIAYVIHRIHDTGFVDVTYSGWADVVRPVVYLKNQLQIINGNGSIDAPYELIG